MQYSTEINPFFEAFVYLTQRFTKNRTSDRIAAIQPANYNMSDDYWAYFVRIADLERELDATFIPDELMCHYFKPLEFREEQPGEFSLSLGFALLTPLLDYSGSLDFDGLSASYSNAPISMIISSLYDTVSRESNIEPTGKSPDLGSFMELLDKTFIHSQDRWDLLDIATNPMKHFEKLRGLVESITEFISERSRGFNELIHQERELFLARKNSLEAIGMLGIEFKSNELDRFIIYPSLFTFNGVSYIVNHNKSNPLFLFLGILVYRVILFRSQQSEMKVYVHMLKLLSDETRLQALHHIRNHYSYGQELADLLHCTRNTMYYHLEKLLSIGFVNCHVTEYRMLYTMNKKTVYEKLTSLRDYLTDGWKPGDPDDHDEPEEGEE